MSVAALSQDLLLYSDARRSDNIAATDTDPDVEAKRKSYIALIDLFARDGALNVDSAKTAARFFSLLPLDRSFPKIASDGEGSLTMLWERTNETLLVVVDGQELLAIVSPATEASTHLPTARIIANSISNRLLGAIPGR